MTLDRMQRIQELFAEALACPPEQRSSFLAEACGADTELLAEVESLLVHQQHVPADFMRQPPRSAEGAQPAVACTPDLPIGYRIGQYRIDGVVASGGMGTVYEAEQENPKRIVALKIMRRGVASRYAMRHFEHESQIMACLSHPNIAQIYEAGTYNTGSGDDESVPFFAMEYVPDARTITQYAAENQASTRRRLKLFAHACDAVHHGHQKGVIHRDLKPGNILVNSAGHVKVIDFGVARSTNADVAVTTIRTDVGQLVGTLQYMSPEQCSADPQNLDTRTDVYSLGMVLYELLCERLPYDVTKSTIPSAARIICEEGPARPALVDRRLRGDLELIMLTAIEKDREKRYQSAAELAKDIRRHLNREPIEARRPTIATHMFRWAARHPATTTTCICLFIAASILAGTWLYNFRPSKLVLGNNGGEATLLAFNGRELKTWRRDEPLDDCIRMARLVRQPSAMDGARLAVLGFMDAYGATPYPNSLCAYDVDGDLESPFWERHIEDEQIPEENRHLLGFVGREFHFDCGMVVDVFPALDGDEIIAIHRRETTTHSVVRVYDLSGESLYQVWVDVLVGSAYWMSDAGLLVLAGVNGAASWPDRGRSEGGSAHPTVVFAIRPMTGFISREYLSEQAGDNPLSPAWYNCLLPPEMSTMLDLSPSHGLSRPGAKHDPGRFVNLTVVPRNSGDGPPGGLSCVLDKFGKVVHGSQVTDNIYKLRQSRLPDPSDVNLGDLPPIISTAQVGNEPPHSRNNGS